MAAAVGEGTGRPPVSRRLLTIVAILLGLSLSLDTRTLFPLVRGMDASEGLVRQSQEYRRQVAANDALEAEVAFLRTRAGAEWAVHRYLGLVKPGQEVGRVVETPAAAPRLQSRPERMQAWIAAQKEGGARALREVGQTALCYAGLRPPDRPPDTRNGAAEQLSKKAKRAGDGP